MDATQAKLGEDTSEGLSWVLCASGTAINILFAMNLPNNGPAIIMAGIPVNAPNKITQPKSALINSATAIGPGVGGIKLWVIANPANNGMA
jgi:hypothetical protein